MQMSGIFRPHLHLIDAIEKSKQSEFWFLSHKSGGTGDKATNRELVMGMRQAPKYQIGREIIFLDMTVKSDINLRP